jgi:hypothetical protein
MTLHFSQRTHLRLLLRMQAQHAADTTRWRAQHRSFSIPILGTVLAAKKGQ